MIRYMECPCHSKKKYAECCQPLHFQKREPKSALELMRSRYSAYSLGLVNYIIDTTFKGSPKYEKDLDKWRMVIGHFHKQTSFDGLKILDHQTFPDFETVTFHATLKQGEQDVSYIEKSTFKKDDGKLKYFDGVFV